MGKIAQVNVENIIFINVDLNDDDKTGGANEAARKKAEDADVQKLILQDVNHALLVDQPANAAEAELDNVLRVMALGQKDADKSTVVLIVQEIRVVAEKDVDHRFFKQEAVVANRGKPETKTVMGKHALQAIHLTILTSP